MWMTAGSMAASWCVTQEAELKKKIEEKVEKAKLEEKLGGAKKKYPGKLERTKYDDNDDICEDFAISEIASWRNIRMRILLLTCFLLLLVVMTIST